MSREGKFLIYCLEIYKAAHHLTGREVMGLFSQCHVSEYITSCYGALHTLGAEYLIEDIDGYLAGNSSFQELVRAWDPDYTKLTPAEAAELEEAEKSGWVDASDIDWDKIGT